MSKYFNNRITSRRFPVPHFAGKAYKTDAETKKAKEDRAIAIKSAEDAYEAFEIKGPEDVKKSFELQKALFELKGADEVKNFEEKMEVIEAALKAAITATETELKELQETVRVDIKGLDQLQARIGKDRSQRAANPESKSFNDYLEDTVRENFEEIKRHNKKGMPELKMEMKAVGDMNIAANFPGATSWTQEVRGPIIESPYNRVWLGDLLPSGTTKASSIIYPKENGGEGAAEPWTDRTANKAQIDFDLTTQTDYVKWIAGWVEIDRDMLDDIDFMVAYLRNKMLISLKIAENAFILNGTSDTNPVRGLLDAATAYDGSFTAAVDRIIDAGWGQIVEDTFDFYNPTTAILTPRDAVKIGLNKASGSGEYDLPNGSVAFANGKLTIGGMTTAPTTQIGTNNFLVFDRTATMFVKRMQPELRMFEDAVLAKKNRVMFRVEERATLAIFNDAALVTGELVEGS